MAANDVPPTLLVIDDDVTMTLLFSKLLGSTGTVVTANSGEEGLALARQIIPDLILLDVQMPGWDGFDVINELKLDPLVRHVPVIFITAEVLPEIESHCLEAGAADYIAKPVTPRVLLARAKTHLLLKKQADMLVDQAFRDPLTGALSTWAFGEMLETECARAAKHGWPTSLLIIEFDLLDEYSAAYGPIAADDALASIAAAIESEVRRPGEKIGRAAVGRFTALLPQTSAPEAQACADRIMATVRSLEVRHSKSPEGLVTVSVGGAGAEGPVTPDMLVRAAEIQLRDSQESGVGHVHVSAIDR
ncbi:MAG: response regulator [Candidatus Nanopelagicales bacterium]